MVSRSGKQRAPAPARRRPPRPPTPPRPTAPAIATATVMQNPTAGGDRATGFTYINPTVTVSDEQWGRLQSLADAAEILTAGSMESAPPGPTNTSANPSETTKTPFDIDDFDLDDIPGPSRRPVRSVKPTPKVRSGHRGGGKDGGRDTPAQPPSPQKKTTKPSAKEVLNRIHRTAQARARADRFNDVADSIVNPYSKETETTSTRPQRLPQVQAFDYSGTASTYLDKEKDPIGALPVDNYLAFNYQEWFDQAKNSMSGLVADTNFDLRPRPIVVTFSTNQRSFKSSPLTVTDKESWKAVITMLKRWKDSGCWYVNIHLKLKFERVAKIMAEVEPKQEYINLSSDDETNYIPHRHKAKAAAEATPVHSDRQKKAIKKASVTEKALLQEKMYMELDGLAKSHIKRICEANPCNRDACTRSAFPCVDFDGTHVLVNQYQLGKWSEMIEKRLATYKRPHDALMDNLRVAAEKARDKAKSKEKERSKPRANSSSNSNSSSDKEKPKRGRKRTRAEYSDPILPMHPAMYQAAALLQGQPLNTYSQLPRRPVADASSPIRIPTEVVCTVLGYTEYCSQRDQARETAWLTAGKALDQNDVTFEQLSTLTGAELREIGISLGIAKDLTTRLKKYIRRQKKLAEESPDDSRPGTASR